MQYAVDKHLVQGLKRTAQRIEEFYHQVSEIQAADGAGQIHISTVEAAIRTFNRVILAAEKQYRADLITHGLQEED